MSEQHPLRRWRDRQEPKRTLASVAEPCGVAVQHIGAIETGHRKPSLALALRLSELTGLGIDAFDRPGRRDWKRKGTEA